MKRFLNLLIALMLMIVTQGARAGATITWDNTNVFTMANQNVELDKWNASTATFEGVTITLSAEYPSGFYCYQYDPMSDNYLAQLLVYDGDSFTFTAPTGEKFSKIEIIDNENAVMDAYGDWTIPADNKAVWSGTPANEVTLRGTNFIKFGNLNSIVFTIGAAEPEPETTDDAKLPGKFSVSAEQVVYFSRGNLQATTADLGTNWTWAFAANQYDCVAANAANTTINGNGTVSTNGTVDLFGWSTAATKYGIHNSTSNSTYSGDFVDWGTNPDLVTSLGSGWRTLTKDEWTYLLNTRTTTSGVRYAKATVDAKAGLIVLPDDWQTSYHALASTNTTNAAFNTNEIDAATWASDFQAHGAVFLPAEGFRDESSVDNVGTYGFYWSATPNGTSYAYYLYFNGSKVLPAYDSYRYFGRSVRLVTTAVSNPIADAQAAVALINAIPNPVVYTPECKAAIDAARAAVDALGDNAKLIDAEDMAKLTAAEAAYQQLLAAVAEVIAKINALPNPVQDTDLKLSVYNKVTSAREAYDALTEEEKAAVTNYAILEAAEAEFAAIGGGGAPAGALNGSFSINGDGDQIAFSKGNLQATTADLGTNWTWAFAANQYDCVAANASNTAINGDGTVSTNGTVDLFGWSTAATKYGIHNSTSNSTFSGDFVDWGSNPDLIAALGSGWRTLTSAEWTYLLTQRTTTSGVRFAKAVITDVTYPGTTTTVKGLIIVPNDWQTSYHTLANTNTDGAAFTTNKITSAVWASDFEAHGAVFLPAAGYRYGTSVYSVGTYGNYWSATPDGKSYAYYLTFDGSKVRPASIYDRYSGCAVRLVTAATASNAIAEAQAAVDSINAIPNPVVYTDSCKAAIDAARAAVDALSDEAKSLIDDSDLAKLTAAEDAYAALEARPTPAFNPAPAAIANLKYTGEAQALITAGVATVTVNEETENCTVLYSLDGETYSEAIPTGVAVGTYTVYYKVEETADYKAFGPDSVNAQILKADAVFTAPVAYDTLAYNAAAQTLIAAGVTEHGTFEYTLVPAEANSWSTYLPQATDAGNYTVYYRIKGDEYHSDVAAASIEVTIAKAALTATADDKAVTYGEEAPAFTVTYTGWQGEDNLSVLTGEIANETNYTRGNNVGDYTITPSGVEAANYTITFVNGKLTVNQAPLTITANDTTVIYGNEAPEFTVTYEGWKNTDDETAVSGLALSSAYTVTSNVGTYDIVPADATATNYEITFVNGTLTVNQAPLTITAEDKEVIYGDEAPAFTVTYEGWKNTDDETAVSGLTLSSAYTVTSNVGTYDIVPADATAQNYEITFVNGTLTVNQAPLTITAEDKEVIYGDEAPAFTAAYTGWKNTDDETAVSGLAYTCAYEQGSYVGTYAINPNSATATNYAITFVDGTLTVNKATVFTSGAEAQIAKFEDGNTDAVVLNNGILNGIKFNDDIDITTTAAFNNAATGENKTITLSYELTGDASLIDNYELNPTSEVFTTEAVIIEPMIPDESADPEDEEADVKEGLEIYAYGYCDGSSYSIRYHLESGNPDQYKIEFDDSRFEDVDWTDLTVTGKEGTIDIAIPEELPTGDYSMTVTFRDSRFTWLESEPITVSFHVNLPETYTAVLFDNVISLVNTCNCMTEVQWYHRDNSDDTWTAINGANGYYYRQVGGLTGEYFVSVKMNEVATYTCPQTDRETLYGSDGNKIVRVNAVPNPIVDNATVTIQGSDKLTHSLSIINLMGAEMEYRTFEGDATTVEMGEYISGNYMISVDGVAVKVIKK